MIFSQYLKRRRFSDGRGFQNSGTFFFRNTSLLDTFSVLVAENFAGQTVRVWNIGASIGAETYSFGAMLEVLRRKGRIANYHIVSSDNVSTNLENIQKNAYSQGLLDQPQMLRWPSWPSVKEVITLGRTISFSSEILSRISLSVFNFNEPDPLFSRQTDSEKPSTFDFIIFNFSLSYARPDPSHLLAVFSRIQKGLTPNGFLIGNFFNVDWQPDSDSDMFQLAAESFLSTNHYRGVETNIWEIFTEDVRRNIVDSCFVKTRLFRWPFSGEKPPSAIFTRNPSAITPALGIHTTQSDFNAFLDQASSVGFYYPALLSLDDAKGNENYRQDCYERFLKAFLQEVRSKWSSLFISIARSEAHLNYPVQWKAIRASRDTLNWLNFNLRQKLNENNLRTFNQLFIEASYRSQNYYLVWEYCKKHPQAVLEQPDLAIPILDSLYFLGLFESMKNYINSMMMEKSVLSYNAKVLAHLTEIRPIINRSQGKSTAQILKDYQRLRRNHTGSYLLPPDFITF
jgi:hypothetical protein